MQRRDKKPGLSEENFSKISQSLVYKDTDIQCYVVTARGHLLVTKGSSDEQFCAHYVIWVKDANFCLLICIFSMKKY